MAIYKGNKKVVAIYKGSTPINKIYKGSTLVFQKGGGGNTHLIEGTATGNFKIYINTSKYIFITPDADGKWFYDTDEELTDLRGAFQYQGAVTSVDLSNLDLTDILVSNMFYRASKITSIKFNNTKSMKLANIQNIFEGCSSLVSLNVSNFDTSNLASGNNLFRGCSSLVSLDLSNWNTSKFEYAPSVFEGCTSLETLDLSNFDMSSMKKDDYCKDMFKNCTSLSTIKCKQAFKDWCITNQDNINLPTAMRNGGTGTWEIIDGSQSDTVVIKFTDASSPAKRQYKPLCEGTTKTATSQTIELPSEGETYKFVNKDTLLEVSNYSNNCPSVTSFYGLFSGATNMKTLTFAKGMDTSKIESMDNMFNRCSSLDSLDLSSFNTINCKDFRAMFNGCSKLVSLDLSSFNTSNCTDFGYMFNSCTSLGSIDLHNFNTSKGTAFDSMFAECSSLVSLDLSSFNTNNCIEFSYMFFGCSSLASIDLSSFNTINCTIFGGMFTECSSLVSLDLSSFNTNNGEDFESMFYGCSSLVSLDLSNFDTSNCTSFSDMFYNCNKLTHIKCKQAFKDWCITNQDTINLPTAMREGGSGTWEIIP